MVIKFRKPKWHVKIVKLPFIVFDDCVISFFMNERLRTAIKTKKVRRGASDFRRSKKSRGTDGWCRRGDGEITATRDGPRSAFLPNWHTRVGPPSRVDSGRVVPRPLSKEGHEWYPPDWGRGVRFRNDWNHGRDNSKVSTGLSQLKEETCCPSRIE